MPPHTSSTRGPVMSAIEEFPGMASAWPAPPSAIGTCPSCRWLRARSLPQFPPALARALALELGNFTPRLRSFTRRLHRRVYLERSLDRHARLRFGCGENILFGPRSITACSGPRIVRHPRQNHGGDVIMLYT